MSGFFRREIYIVGALWLIASHSRHKLYDVENCFFRREIYIVGTLWLIASHSRHKLYDVEEFLNKFYLI